jgi:hypothetical protein
LQPQWLTWLHLYKKVKAVVVAADFKHHGNFFYVYTMTENQTVASI